MFCHLDLAGVACFNLPFGDCFCGLFVGYCYVLLVCLLERCLIACVLLVDLVVVYLVGILLAMFLVAAYRLVLWFW